MEPVNANAPVLIAHPEIDTCAAEDREVPSAAIPDALIVWVPFETHGIWKFLLNVPSAPALMVPSTIGLD